MILTTTRLTLRPFTRDDFTAVHAYASVPENICFMLWGPNTEEDTHEFLQRCISNAEEKPDVYHDYAVCLRETGEVIGGCGLNVDQDNNAGSLGWLLHRDHWRKGYGTELAGALIEYGFTTLKLHRLFATCDAENYGSYRVMERNYMRREAHYRQCRLRHGQYRDEYLYAILREEWEARQ